MVSQRDLRSEDSAAPNSQIEGNFSASRSHPCSVIQITALVFDRARRGEMDAASRLQHRASNFAGIVRRQPKHEESDQLERNAPVPSKDNFRVFSCRFREKPLVSFCWFGSLFALFDRCSHCSGAGHLISSDISVIAGSLAYHRMEAK